MPRLRQSREKVDRQRRQVHSCTYRDFLARVELLVPMVYRSGFGLGVQHVFGQSTHVVVVVVVVDERIDTGGKMVKCTRFVWHSDIWESFPPKCSLHPVWPHHL